jgi:hypothetical protein
VLRLALGGVRALFGLGARQRVAGSRGGFADGIEGGTRRAPRRLLLRVRFHGCHQIFFVDEVGAMLWREDARCQ